MELIAPTVVPVVVEGLCRCLQLCAGQLQLQLQLYLVRVQQTDKPGLSVILDLGRLTIGYLTSTGLTSQLSFVRDVEKMREMGVEVNCGRHQRPSPRAQG